MDALIWQMAKLHCFWESNNYRLPFLCPSMLLSVVLHRPGMQILRNGCVSSRFILEEGLPTPCGDLSPEPLLKSLSSPCFLSMASSKGQWDASIGSLSMSPGSTGQRELTTESCPLISALLPPSLTYTPVDYMCLDWFLRYPLFLDSLSLFLWESCYFDYCSFLTLTSSQEVWFSFFIMYLLLGDFIVLCGHQVFFSSTPVKNLNGILQGLHWAMYCFG